MNKVIINVQHEYTVYIDSDSLHTIGRFIPPEYDSSKIAIITDDTVARLYLNTVVVALEKAGFHPVIFICEQHILTKDTDSCTEIIHFFSKNLFSRSDLVLALGGSNIINLVGFCCSIYHCGIDYFALPTTLIGMVDTAIGGKINIKTSLGKNVVGTFYHPKAVICDITTLQSLSITQQRNASSLMLQYAAIYDKQLFNMIRLSLNKSDMIALITRLIRIKTIFVSEDEFDKGNRIILKFGHTIGNIIDSYHNYELPYGESLAMGMAMITKLSEKYGLSKPGTYRFLINQIANSRFDTSCKIPLSYLNKQIIHDNYYYNNTLKLVLLKEAGKPYIFHLKHHMISSFFDGTYKK